MQWYALDVDEGVVAEAPTKRDLVSKVKYAFIKDTVTRLGPGVYEITDNDPDGDYQTTYVLMRSTAPYKHGFEWAIEQHNEKWGIGGS